MNSIKVWILFCMVLFQGIEGAFFTKAIAEKFLEHIHSEGKPFFGPAPRELALLEAVAQGDLRSLKRLLGDAGCRAFINNPAPKDVAFVFGDCSQNEYEGRTPLHLLCNRPFSCVAFGAFSEKEDGKMAKLLLQHGANPLIGEDTTPLQVATWYGHIGIIKALFAHGVSPNECDDKGEPLMLQAFRSNVVTAYIANGMDLKRRYEGDNTILHLAVKNQGRMVVEELLKTLLEPKKKRAAKKLKKNKLRARLL